jgi:hypothetical protein
MNVALMDLGDARLPDAFVSLDSPGPVTVRLDGSPAACQPKQAGTFRPPGLACVVPPKAANLEVTITHVYQAPANGFRVQLRDFSCEDQAPPPCGQ